MQNCSAREWMEGYERVSKEGKVTFVGKSVKGVK